MYKEIFGEGGTSGSLPWQLRNFKIIGELPLTNLRTKRQVERNLLVSMFATQAGHMSYFGGSQHSLEDFGHGVRQQDSSLIASTLQQEAFRIRKSLVVTGVWLKINHP